MLKIKACSLSLLDGCGCLCCSGGRTCPWGRTPGVTRGRGGTLGPQSDARVPRVWSPQGTPRHRPAPGEVGTERAESSALHTPPAHPSDMSIAAKVHLKTVFEHYLDGVFSIYWSIFHLFSSLFARLCLRFLFRFSMIIYCCVY